jgi:hypothetical protein
MYRLVAYLGILASIILGGILGGILDFTVLIALDLTCGSSSLGAHCCSPRCYLSIIPLLVGTVLGAFLGGVLAIIHVRRYMRIKQTEKELAKYLGSIPENAGNLIKSIIGEMRYRKEVQNDVMAELAAHFEDELRSCKTDEEKQQKAQRLIEDFGDAKLLGILLRRAKKRCRPLWRTVVARTFQTIGVLILCFILYCIYISLGKPTIAVNYVEEATRLNRPLADESLNAAPIYQKAFDVYNEPPLVKYETGTEKKNLLDAIKDKDWITELTKEELASLKQWLSNNTNTIELFKQASEKPYCWWKMQAKDNFMMAIPLPELANVRKIAKMTVWQAKLKVYNGHIEEACDDLLACYRAGKHFKGPRTLIEQLVGTAIQAMAVQNMRTILHNQKVDSQLLKSFQARFEDLIDKDTYVMNYKVEKFCILDFIQRCYTDNGRGSGHLIPGQLQKFMNVDEVVGSAKFGAGEILAISVTSANRRKMSQEFEKIYSTAQEWATKTPWQLHKENVDFGMGFDKWSCLKKIRYSFVRLLTPVTARANEIAYRIKADTYATLTIIALFRYEQDKGSYPSALDDLLQTGYLKQLPMDPWSDKPLVYKTTADGFMLYSVGSDFKDDGGQVVRDAKGKIKPYADEGDWVFWPMQK